MSMIQSHFEINVSHNGQHFFATEERSAVNSYQARNLYRVLKAKFPESEGYRVDVTEIHCSGTQVDTKDWPVMSLKPVSAPKSVAAVNRPQVARMESELQMYFGFTHKPELAGPGGSYTVWQNKTERTFKEPLEVRLFTNRMFRIIAFSGQELHTGIGLRALRTMLKKESR
jgi:hypothetical protein